MYKTCLVSKWWYAVFCLSLYTIHFIKQTKGIYLFLFSIIKHHQQKANSNCTIVQVTIDHLFPSHNFSSSFFFILSLSSETYLSGISLPTFTTLSFEVQLITGYVHNLPPSRILYSLNYSFPFVNFFVFVFGIS